MKFPKEVRTTGAGSILVEFCILTIYVRDRSFLKRALITEKETGAACNPLNLSPDRLKLFSVSLYI